MQTAYIFGGEAANDVSLTSPVGLMDLHRCGQPDSSILHFE